MSNTEIDDNQLKDYYNNFFSMFKHDGWKQLVETLEVDAKRLNSVEDVKDTNDLFLKKGQLQAVAWLLNFESVCSNAWDDLQRQVDDDASDI